MRNAGLDEAQAGIKIAGRNINNLRYVDDAIVMAESKELKSLLMKVKKESEKFGLKLNIQKTEIMASGPITSWQIDREAMETVSDFILGGSKITADGDCNDEIKRHLLLGRKVMTNLDSMLKSRDITLPTKVHLAKALVFNTLSRFIIAFLLRSNCLLISWPQSPSAVILEPPKIKSLTVSIASPPICHKMMGPDAMISVF